MKRKNITLCRNLRKKQTDAENKLWRILRNRQLGGVKFRRQFSIDRYILDFYVAEYNLGIEIDGGQHYEEEVRQRDEERTKYLLEKKGVKILRFNNLEILNNIEGVYESIKGVLEDMGGISSSPPSPPSSPSP